MPRNLIQTTLLNRYRFEDLVGEGTFARVYRVHDLKRNVDLAAKVLREDIALEPTFLERFRREAQVLAHLQHPHIVRYYETVEADGVVFMLLDYIPADNMQSYLYKLGAVFTVSHALQFLKPLTAALTYAHGEGIIHRDIKPANILLGNNGQVYITDFGIARLLNEASTLTQDSMVGTPLYMSPEQLLGNPVTLTSDIYAVGVLLYQMFAGQPPFIGKSPQARGETTAEKVIYEHLNLAPLSPCQHNPALPAAAEEVILRCLRKDPASRYPSALAIHDALAETIGADPANFEPVSLDIAKPKPPDKTLPEWSKVVPKIETAEIPASTLVHQEAIPDPSPSPEANVARPTVIGTPDYQRQTLPNMTPTPPPHPVASYQPPTYTPTPPPPAYWSSPTSPYTNHIPRRPKTTQNTMLILLIMVMLFITLVLCGVGGMLAWNILKDDSKTQPPSPTTSTELRQTSTPTQSTNLFIQPTVIAETSVPLTPLPSATPDESQGVIIFSRDSDGSLDLFEMNLATNQMRQLTSSSLNEAGAEYSPDASQIAYYAYQHSGNADIWLMDSTGENARNLTDTPTVDERVVTWSPDGTQLAFHADADGGDYDLYAYTLATGETRNLTNTPYNELAPSWSPDGTQLAFHSDEIRTFNEIFILNLATSERKAVTDGQWKAAFPAWMDANTLSFHSILGANTYQLNLITPDGNNFSTVLAGNNQRHPAWSQDGQQVLYMADSLYDPVIYRFDPATGNETRIIEGHFPAWKPTSMESD